MVLHARGACLRPIALLLPLTSSRLTCSNRNIVIVSDFSLHYYSVLSLLSSIIISWQTLCISDCSPAGLWRRTALRRQERCLLYLSFSKSLFRGLNKTSVPPRPTLRAYAEADFGMDESPLHAEELWAQSRTCSGLRRPSDP